ncbi:MAG TPA: hypothetical protein VGE62_01540 [Candidatus Paceibacterota bacterium]
MAVLLANMQGWKRCVGYAKVLGMDEQIQELNEKIDELREIVEDNARMTASLYKRAKFAMYGIILKWFIIIGITIGAFYYVQPLIDGIVQTYSGLTGGSGTDLFNLIKSF